MGSKLVGIGGWMVLAWVLGQAAALAQDVVLRIAADQPGSRISRYLMGACIEDVNHEIYGGLYSQMIFGESFQEPPPKPAEPGGSVLAASGMWQPILRGGARGDFAIVTDRPFAGKQSQRVVFQAGSGVVGLANRGLKGWGMRVVSGKPCEGYLWARASAPVELTVAFESGDGGRVLGTARLPIKSGDWARHEFTLTPSAGDPRGRFALWLDQPGSIELGHVFLQPGPWGRFHDLPDRKDVGDALVDLGVRVLRYGGSMINHPGYRWKKMIGPRDRRPPYTGTWYPYSSNGWGIFDFLDFCEAAGFLAIPAVNIDETPQDMADFVEYANGPAESAWGRKRAADGHPAPYKLKHLELGNEEAVNQKYWERFQNIALAVWARDPEIILIVGDFAYHRVIEDPFHFEGGAAVQSLQAHQKILELARAHGREVWFDIHIGTDHPPEPHGLKAERSYIEQLRKLAPGAKFKVAIFEYNSGNHALKRALANALATHEVERLGEILAVACSANCLQPDGQNDNGWDQGLVFLNPSQVWLQPPGYVLRMVSRNDQPLLVPIQLEGRLDTLSINVKKSEDGKVLVLQAVNWGGEPRVCDFTIAGFRPTRPTAVVEQLSGELEAVNTAEHPDQIVPRRQDWRHHLDQGHSRIILSPRSFTVVRFE